MSTTDRKAGKAEASRLFDAAFNKNTRQPRSKEYKAGAYAVLSWRCGAVATMPRCPHPLGTAQADAWFAGTDEGNVLWRQSLPAQASQPTQGERWGMAA